MVWPELANAGSLVMLRYAVLKCCDCLTELANAGPSILRFVVLICFARLFGRGFRWGGDRAANIWDKGAL